ncbi:MAG TPA: NAD(P)/FAD-dependent oxidoreductase [Marmoricola sp.]|nr:NAD(P)/FAD-dependent oxidoreductase [Marmoricola sp.]
MDMNIDESTWDVVVIGGGPAGLQAALTLGRMRRRVLLLDSEQYRNGTVHEMHNFLTHDGDDPALFREGARAELKRYETVAVREARVSSIEEAGDGWRLTLDGGEELRSRRIVLATGLRDTLPTVPGLEELWGDVVAHCPYCHGHELRDRPVALLGAGPHTPAVAMLVSRLASRLVVVTDGGTLDPETAGHLTAAGVEIVDQRVTEVRRSAEGAAVRLADGTDVDVAGIFVAPTPSQASPFAQRLGLDLLPSGGVRVDELARTSRPGVFAAGDMAHVAGLPMPLASVLNAAAAGLVAGSSVDRDLLMEEHPWLQPR